MPNKQLEKEFDFFKVLDKPTDQKKKSKNKIINVIKNTIALIALAGVFSLTNIVIFFNNTIITPINFTEILTSEQKIINEKINLDLKDALNVVYKDDKGKVLRNSRGGLIYRQNVSAKEINNYHSKIAEITQRTIENNQGIQSAQEAFDLLNDSFWVTTTQKENIGKIIEQRIKSLYSKTNQNIINSFDKESYFSGVKLLGVENYQLLNKIYIAEKYGFGWLKYKHQYDLLDKSDIASLYMLELEKLKQNEKNEFDNLFEN